MSVTYHATAPPAGAPWVGRADRPAPLSPPAAGQHPAPNLLQLEAPFDRQCLELENHHMDQPHRFNEDDDTTRVFVRTATRLQPALAAPPSRRAPRPVSVAAGGDTLWDANDVARYLKVSRSWVYHRAEAGLMPHLRVGGLLRFHPDVVRSFVGRR